MPPPSTAAREAIAAEFATAPRTGPRPEWPRRHGRGDDQPGGGPPRPRGLRPGHRPRDRPRRRRHRPPDRDLPNDATRRPADRSSASSRPGPRSSWPARASCAPSSTCSTSPRSRSATVACGMACSRNGSERHPSRGGCAKWRNDMTARPAGAPARLSDERPRPDDEPHEGVRQRRAQAHRPRREPSRDDRQPAARPGRGPAPADLLLRHAGPRPWTRPASWRAHDGSPVAGVTPSSSFDRSSRTSCRATPAARRRSTSSSMRCPAGSSARAR